MKEENCLCLLFFKYFCRPSLFFVLRVSLVFYQKKKSLSLIACFFVVIRFLKPAGCKKRAKVEEV